MAQRRLFTPFSLSFLDIMSCGFGSVVLLFLIIKHNIDSGTLVPAVDLTPEVALLQEELQENAAGAVAAREAIAAVNEALAALEETVRRVMEKIRDLRSQAEQLGKPVDAAKLERLKTTVKELETEKQQLLAQPQKTGNDARSMVGKGDREYLTGLKMGGRRILILLDSSASMLDDTIVNIIRFRNMEDRVKRNARKWVQAVKTVEWLLDRLPAGSRYQVMAFNTETRPPAPGLAGRWLDVGDRKTADQVVAALRQIAPQGGTNLEQAFAAIDRLRPQPDNVYLLTDGLPTQGSKTRRRTTITGKQRLDLFRRAEKKLSSRIPINVILTPLEGDHEAAYAFWRLAVNTNGSFLAPSQDWP